MKKQTLQKVSRIILLPVCLALCSMLSACVPQEPLFDFYALERQDYENENGYTIQFPADWQLLEEDQESSTFISGDGALSCTISFELGGVEVYSLEEVGQMLMESLGEGLFASYEAGEPSLGASTYRNQLQGLTAEEEALSVDVNVYHRQEGVRYYMTFLTPTASYEEQRPLIDAIMDSFETTKQGDELYEMMMQRREEQAQAEWEEAMDALEEDGSAPETEEFEPENEEEKE